MMHCSAYMQTSSENFEKDSMYSMTQPLLEVSD
jgi:hypothetical protein